MRPNYPFKPGDAVVVTSGTFENFTATVAGTDERGVLIQTMIFGRLTDPFPIGGDILRYRTPDDKDHPQAETLYRP